jgi:DNA-binding SARP family transcriptional activator/class 3 adenylate cyclase
VEFRILGPLEAHKDGVVVALGGTKQRALLAFLLLHANEVVPTERLIEALWERPPGRPGKAVQVYVSRLRKALGGEMPRSRPPGYLLELEPDLFDLARFQRLVEEARGDQGRAADLLVEALTLWRGPALAEFTSEPFARVERLRLEELRLEALEKRIDAELALGRHASLVPELEALVEAEPLREHPRWQLMLSLYRCGRQAEALAVYRNGRRLLVAELGIEPGRQLQELEQGILRQDPALEVDEPSPPRPVEAAPATTPPVSESSDEARGEERKVVSVLFCNLVGFTARSDLADPEDVRTALRPFHVVARREIERYGGSVEKFIGDAVMGLFGAPFAHEDDPERAVRAALAIRQWIRDEGAGLEVRMAVNSGVALVALDAQPHEGEAMAAGDVVNTAQRLEAAAPVDTILVGERTYRATREAILYREHPPVWAKGKAEPIPVWEALQARARVGAESERGTRTPLVGRGRELELLLSTFARVREERSPQLVTLVGVPGMGKSRLAFEFAEVLDRDTELIAWRQGRCLPYGEGVTFWALGEIVKAQAGILESDLPAEVEGKLHHAVAALGIEEPEVPWVEEHLRTLVGAGEEPASEERSGDAFPAWRRFFQALAEAVPLVCVFEDLHWADEGLLAFVDELTDRVRGAPMLLLCTARPELLERRPGWGGGKANALTLSLPPLSDEETGQILSTLEGHVLAPQARERFLTRAGGNPLYAEQFARLLAEGGSLDELPESVQGIIAARLDGLLLAEKALLQDASVVGEVFWPGALAMIGERPRAQAEELLFALERKEFVQRARRSSIASETEYAFCHVLLRDVAYSQIPRATRAEKHRRAAAWIETLGRSEDHAEMLAHHHLSALEYARAAGREDLELVEPTRLALRAAGERALALTSYTAAARFFDAALELWPADDSERVWLVVRAGTAHYGAAGTGIELLEQGFEQLVTRGDADGAAEVAVQVARCFWEGGDRDAAYAYVDRALELAEGRTRSKARAHALVARAAYHMLGSEHEQAISLAREALPLTEALGMPELQIRALDVLGGSRTYLGEDVGLDDSRKAVALARAHNAFAQLLPAEINLYENEFYRGHTAAAWETLHTFRQDGERYAKARNRDWVRTAEAVEGLLTGRWEAAIEIVDHLITDAEASGSHYLEPAYRTLRASTQLARGDLEGAAENTKNALARARQTKDPQLLAPVLAMRASVLLARNERNDAAKLALEVLTLGSPPLTALLELFSTANPIEFAWLLNELNLSDELRQALASTPSTPWMDGARAIASGKFADAVEIVTQLGLPAIEAHTRLRAAQALTEAGDLSKSHEVLAPALVFFKKVGATRYLAQAQELLATPG